MKRDRILVEVFPKFFAEYDETADACGPDCICSGVTMGQIQRLNEDFLGMVHRVANDAEAPVTVQVYRYTSRDDRASAIARLNEFMGRLGYKSFHEGEEARQILELMTPVLAVSGEICAFGTYPPREALERALGVL